MAELVNYRNLAQEINHILKTGQNKAAASVNILLLQTYWQIGQKIVEFEQKGNL